MLKERAPQIIEMQKLNSTHLKSYYLKNFFFGVQQPEGKKKTKKLHNGYGSPLTSSSYKISNPVGGLQKACMNT